MAAIPFDFVAKCVASFMEKREFYRTNYFSFLSHESKKLLCIHAMNMGCAYQINFAKELIFDCLEMTHGEKQEIFRQIDHMRLVLLTYYEFDVISVGVEAGVVEHSIGWLHSAHRRYCGKFIIQMRICNAYKVWKNTSFIIDTMQPNLSIHAVLTNLFECRSIKLLTSDGSHIKPNKWGLKKFIYRDIPLPIMQYCSFPRFMTLYTLEGVEVTKDIWFKPLWKFTYKDWRYRFSLHG